MAAFLEKVAALGLAPRLLSGEEEAVASAHGVLSAFPGARGGGRSGRRQP
jgi:exopolyphosphatase/guanosine-5'-triphosphate,3'-diphosphate pyrophosphatase